MHVAIRGRLGKKGEREAYKLLCHFLSARQRLELECWGYFIEWRVSPSGQRRAYRFDYRAPWSPVERVMINDHEQVLTSYCVQINRPYPQDYPSGDILLSKLMLFRYAPTTFFSICGRAAKIRRTIVGKKGETYVRRT